MDVFSGFPFPSEDTEASELIDDGYADMEEGLDEWNDSNPFDD